MEVENVRKKLLDAAKLLFDAIAVFPPPPSKPEQPILRLIWDRDSDMLNEEKEVMQEQASRMALKFTKKEISSMPQEYQNYITVDVKIPVRQKPNGVYEARYRAHGLNICVSSKERSKLKTKFLSKLMEAAHAGDLAPTADRVTVSEMCRRWLELRRPTIKDDTAKEYARMIAADIDPAIGKLPLAKVRQSDLQEFVNAPMAAGHGRTAEKRHQLLRSVLDLAVGDGILDRSPMHLVRPPVYDTETGEALTPVEEKKLLQMLDGQTRISSPVHDALLFLLYTGMRRGELSRIKIEDGFFAVGCGKIRKGKREKVRLVPITPMLAAVLPGLDLEGIRTVRPDALTQAMHRLMPQHHLHDLRHTFITRCQECHVPREVVSAWAGHAPDSSLTSTVYTHFSREFMLQEARKVIYDLDALERSPFSPQQDA